MKRIIVGHHSLSIPSIALHVHDTLYSLYQVLTLMTKTYTKALLKDKKTHGGHSISNTGSSPWRLRPTRRLCWKMKVLLTITHTGYIRFSLWWLTFTSYIRFLSWRIRPVRLSWKTKVLLMVTPTAYIRSLLWRLSLHRDSSKRWKSSWWLLQLISGPHPDS